MRSLSIAPIVAVLATAALPSTAQSQPADTAPKLKHWERNGCSQPTVRARYRNQVRRTWRFSHRGGNFLARPKRDQPGLRRQRLCARSEKAHDKMIGFTHRRQALWRWHREIDRITPYGKWAIPSYIVMCESGGSWSAYNPSGASGPYQLLGWGAPMPANTPMRQATHHRIAARLWAGGSGASHWVCR